MDKDLIEIKIVRANVVIPCNIHIELYDFIKLRLGGEFTRLNEKEFFNFYTQYLVVEFSK